MTLDAVERQLDAYNARDAEAFAACYAEDVVVLDGDGDELMRGRDVVLDAYASMFARSPNLRAEVRHRLRVGPFVVDEERVTGTPRGDLHAIAIYRLSPGGLIDRVQFLEA